jgi:hypothetical protein
MDEQELLGHRKRLLAQLGLCQQRYATTKDDKWVDRQLACDQVIATIDNSLVLEHGLRRLFEVLQADLINDTARQIVEGAGPGDQGA